MFDSMHKYFCPHCRIYIAASTAARLCVCLNDHNHQKHVGNCITWEPGALLCSMHYEEPNDPISTWTDHSPEERNDIREGISKAVFEALKEYKDETDEFWRSFRPLPARSEQKRLSAGTKVAEELTPGDKKLLKGVLVKW